MPASDRAMLGRSMRSGFDEPHPPSPEPVPQRGHPDEEAGEHQRVDVDDPQLLGAGRLQVGGDVRQGEEQHQAVDRDEQHRQHKHCQTGRQVVTLDVKARFGDLPGVAMPAGQ